MEAFIRLTEEQFQDLIRNRNISKPKDLVPPGQKHSGVNRKGRVPNKTEAEYGRMLSMEFPDSVIMYEGLTFKMRNGHKYTPDWIVNLGGGQVLCVEVKARGKNGFRHSSYQRARLAFDQCRAEWSNYQWRWAEKSGGIWNGYASDE